MNDLKYAWRSLSHRRTTTLAAVVCLALGIGANAALFAVLDALLFKAPAGVSAPGELLRLRVGVGEVAARMGAGQSVTYPAYTAARERLSAVANVAAYAPRGLTLGGGESAEHLEGIFASGNYFEVLGVHPRVGRLFGDAEDAAPGEPVAVLSHGAWQRRFGGSMGVIGTTIELNGVAVSVIGVAPPGFRGVDLGNPDVWVTLGASALEAFGGARHRTDRVYWLQMVARRAPGATQQVVSAAAAGGAPAAAGGVLTPLHAVPLRPMFFAEQQGRNPVPVWSIGITLIVLLLACATVANLLLAQGAAREREIAVRLALGAPRPRILRQLLIENAIIAATAAVGATLIAGWSGALLSALPVPPIHRLVDLRVAGFALVAAGCTTLLFGVAPALWTVRGGIDAVLRRGGHTTGRGSSLQQALMVTQIAFSFLLLVGAGLFTASFTNVQRIDPGFELGRLLTATLELRTMPGNDHAALLERATARVKRVPGVESVSFGRIVPFYFFSRGSFTIADGRSEDEQPLSVLTNEVDGDYFRTFGIGISAGRPLDANDRSAGLAAAVVSEALALEYWPGRSPLGACLRVDPASTDCVSVVGVARDVRFSELRGEPTQLLYLPATSDRAGAATMFIRTSGDPAALAQHVRRAIQGIDGRMPFVEVMPLDARARPQRIPWEVAATLFTAFGSLATFLAAIGLYMVVAFLVRQRTRELGIRSALGATHRDIVRLVLRHGMRLTAWGIVIGGAGALVVGRLLASRLYGVASADPATFIAAALLLACVAIAASWLPAREATRVEPAGVLREP